MEPFITIGLVQDTNWWALGAQYLMAVAVIVAAVVTVRIPFRKELVERRKKKRYYIGILQLIFVGIETFKDNYAASKCFNEFEETYLRKVLSDIQFNIDIFKSNILDIAMLFDMNTVKVLQLFLQVTEIYLSNYKEREEISYLTILKSFDTSFKEVVILRNKALKSMMKDLKPSPCLFSWLSLSRREKRKASKKPKSNGEKPSEPQSQTLQP